MIKVTWEQGQAECHNWIKEGYAPEVGLEYCNALESPTISIWDLVKISGGGLEEGHWEDNLSRCWGERLFVRQKWRRKAVEREEHFYILVGGYYAHHYGPGIAAHQDMILDMNLEGHCS